MAEGEDKPSRRTLVPHPLRPAVLGEVHARPFHPVAAPRRILHFAFLTDPGQMAAARTALADFCEARGIAAPRQGTRHFRAEFGGMCLRWETHAEFSSYTWELPSVHVAPFTPPPDMVASVMDALPQPGRQGSHQAGPAVVARGLGGDQHDRQRTLAAHGLPITARRRG